MNIHARDRKRWFAANFGRSYFHSQPLINPLGLALGLAIPICILALLVMLAADSHTGYVLAITPLLAQAREKAARTLNKAKEISTRNADKTAKGEAWPAEDQTNFDAAMKEFATANNEVTVAQAREEQMELLTRGEENYLRPQQTVTQPAGDGGQGGSISEIFSRYLHFGRFNKAKKKVELSGVSDVVVEQCVQIHREAFMAYVRGDLAGMRQYASTQNVVGPREIQALLSTDQTLGGVLCPEDTRAEVLKAEAGVAVLGPLCRTEPTARDTLVWRKIKPHSTDGRRTSGFTGKFQQQGYVTGGTAPTVQDQPTFQRERIPVKSWQPDVIEISPELLDDNDANLEGIIAEAIGECLGFDKDDEILAGSGAGEHFEGITKAGISQIASGGATSIEYAGVLDLFTGTPVQYRRNGTFVMSSKTMGTVLKLNTGTGGVYLFPPNQWNNEILTRPVVFMDYGMDEPTTGTTYTAGANPIIFGNWRYYIIAQRAGLRIQRLIERFAPNIAFLPTARVGGQCVLTDAFRMMKIAAS